MFIGFKFKEIDFFITFCLLNKKIKYMNLSQIYHGDPKLPTFIVRGQFRIPSFKTIILIIINNMTFRF